MKMLHFLMIIASAYSVICYANLDEEQLDPMIDFAYPVSMMQSIRHDISSAVYALRHDNKLSAESLLENVVARLISRIAISDDDREYIQEMINQINILIAQLEDRSDYAHISDLSQQVSEKL